VRRAGSRRLKANTRRKRVLREKLGAFVVGEDAFIQGWARSDLRVNMKRHDRGGGRRWVGSDG
jgi:hypothetical protein